MRLGVAAFVFGFALVLSGTSASAELFRCTGPDGKTIFTDQKHTCPGADPSEPTGVVHRAETPEGARRDAVDPTADVPAAPARGPQMPDVQSEEAQWKQKKLDAEHEIERIRARRDWIKAYVGHCNRGGYVTTRDDAGIQQVVNCSMLKREFSALETQEASAREYLANGLPEECRRAGCLPGWLR